MALHDGRTTYKAQKLPKNLLLTFSDLLNMNLGLVFVKLHLKPFEHPYTKNPKKFNLHTSSSDGLITLTERSPCLISLFTVRTSNPKILKLKVGES